MADSGTDSEQRLHRWKRLFCEIKALLILSLPVSASNMARYAMNTTDLIYLGHFGKTEMAAAALANTWAYITLYIALGPIFAMDTLVSQAYGAKNYRRVGILLQSAIVVCFVLLIPVGLLWIITGDVMHYVLQQSPHVSNLSELYTRLLLPGVAPFLLYRCLLVFLQNQKITMPGMIVGSIAVGLNVFLNWLLIYGLHLGFPGSPIATSISRGTLPILLVGWVVWRGYHKQTWHGFRREAVSLKALSEYLRIGIPSGLAVLFEVAGFEGMIVLAGWLGSRAVDITAVAYQYLIISYIVPSGLSAAAATRVGNLLGEERVNDARYAARVAVSFTTIVMVVNAAILIAARRPLVEAFAPYSEIVDRAGPVMIACAFVTLFDGAIAAQSGVLRGIGRVKITTISSFVGYYCVSLPTAAVLVFDFGVGMGEVGLWVGMVCGEAVIATVQGVVLARLDWQKEMEVAVARALQKMETKYSELNTDEKQDDQEGLELAETEKHFLDQTGAVTTTEECEVKASLISPSDTVEREALVEAAAYPLEEGEYYKQ